VVGAGPLIAALAIRCGIAPSVLWEEDPRDLATMLDLLELEEQG
jgi:hypothetical protein